MTERISIAEAQERLPSIVGAMKAGGDPVEIEDRGRVVAAIVPADRSAASPTPTSAAITELRELFGSPTDDEIDAFLADVYAQRTQDLGRPVDFGE